MSARVEAITSALEAALAPHSLEVIDESHKHVGHEGARDGRGHFAVKVVSAAFAGMSPLSRHRRIYEALGGLMQTDIHAFSIVLAKTPDEADSA